MRNQNQLTRRRLLAGSAGVVAAGVAGCQGLPLVGGGSSLQTVAGFEDDLASWNANPGAEMGSGVQEDVYKSGAGALKLVNVGAMDSSVTSLPGDGLEHYPERGDTVAVWGRNGGGDDPQLGLCYLWQTVGSYTQNPGSGYAARIHPADDRIDLRKVVDGEDVTGASATTSASLNDDQWYRFVVTTASGGSHEFRLDDTSGAELASVSMQDSTWDSGGYGLAYSGNNTSGKSTYWDGLALSV